MRDTLAGRTLLNALPMPVWFRDDDGRIEWVNEAYVRAVEAGSEGEVRERQIELLEMRQREAAGAALAKGTPYRERVHLISGGARKAHDVVVLPLEGASVGAAIDVAALETAQGELVRHVAAYERTLDRVATGRRHLRPRPAARRSSTRPIARCGSSMPTGSPPSPPTASCSTACASCRACRRW